MLWQVKKEKANKLKEAIYYIRSEIHQVINGFPLMTVDQVIDSSSIKVISQTQGNCWHKPNSEFTLE